jgi:hypothetical protein
VPEFNPCSNSLFTRTGDVRPQSEESSYHDHVFTQDARTWLPQLGALADSQLKILIWVKPFFNLSYEASIDCHLAYRLEMQISSEFGAHADIFNFNLLTDFF